MNFEGYKIFGMFTGIPLAILFCLWWVERVVKKETSNRDRFIQVYIFPPRLDRKLAQLRPELSAEQRLQVWDALRMFFLLIRRLPRQRIDMPSRVVDDAWHLFILETAEYQAFCKKAFGRFLHHHPTGDGTEPVTTRLRQVSVNDPKIQALREFIPAGAFLPVLFTMDQELRIAAGFEYQPTPRQPEQVASSSGGSGCGTFVSACSSGSDGGGGCGGGCGGD